MALLARGDATGPALDPGERCGTDPAAVPAFVDPALATTVRAALGLDGAEPLTCAAAAPLRSLKPDFAGIPVSCSRREPDRAHRRCRRRRVPMDAERILAGHTVLVRGDRIVEVGPAGSVEVPAAAGRIDGSGKYLLSGLAEMHGHMSGGNATEQFRERLMVCLNPRLGEERRRKRELLAATGETRERIAASVRAAALSGKAGIGRRMSREANRRMAGKHFGIRI